MTALRELIGAIERGETPEAHAITSALRPLYSGEEAVVAYVRMACDASDIRALGAARALHEAVLPMADGWWWSVEHHDPDDPQFRADVWRNKKPYLKFQALADNPARAWLLAILKALEAQS